MVEIADIIAPEGIILDLKGCNSKRQVLKELAQHAATMLGLDQQHLLDALMERERLGTTGIGHGIAIPHARLGEVTRLAGLFARLDHPVDFESLDDLPSDLIFLLLAPDSADADSPRRSRGSRACCAIPASGSACARRTTARRCTGC
jgi:PTS system nitrogen regulatory IIA component